MKAPAFQFYPRQFSGDDQVMKMDLDVIGAHILLICCAAASPERCRIYADDRAIRTLLRNPSDEQWQRIKSQLLAGAWKLSADGQWWEQSGLRATFDKQKSFSEEQKKRAARRWDAKPANSMPDECRSDAEAIPESCSSSSSSSSNLNTTTPTPSFEHDGTQALWDGSESKAVVGVVVEPKPAKRTRRTRQTILESFSPETATLVNEIWAIWPDFQKKDNSIIHKDPAMTAGRIEELRRIVPDDVLMESAKRYLAEGKRMVKAPQYFFGPGVGADVPPWKPYVQMVMYERQKANGATA